MNHLESSFAGKNSAWRYIVMIAAVLIASNTIGALPLLIIYGIKVASDPSLISSISDNPNDLSILGMDPNIGLAVMLFPFIAGLLTFFLLIKPLNHRTFLSTINGTGSIRWNRFFISGLVWLGLSATYLLIYLKVDPLNFTLNNNTVTLIMLVAISALLIPFQAAFEEVIFRGYLLQGFAVLLHNRWFPLVITSVLFGLMHAFNPEVKEFGFFTMIPQYVLFGLIFGIITVVDDGIEAAMGAHAANNIFLCVMVTHKSSALRTEALFEQRDIYPWTEVTALLITGILFIVILKMIFKWKSFSQLLGKVTPPAEPYPITYTDDLSSLR